MREKNIVIPLSWQRASRRTGIQLFFFCYSTYITKLKSVLHRCKYGIYGNPFPLLPQLCSSNKSPENLVLYLAENNIVEFDLTWLRSPSAGKTVRLKMSWSVYRLRVMLTYMTRNESTGASRSAHWYLGCATFVTVICFSVQRLLGWDLL